MMHQKNAQNASQIVWNHDESLMMGVNRTHIQPDESIVISTQQPHSKVLKVARKSNERKIAFSKVK